MLKPFIPAAIAALFAATSAAAQTPAAITDLGGGLVGEYYAPPAKGGPTVLVLGGSEGGLRGAAPLAKALAEQGFGALALAYFDAPGLPQVLEDVPLETFTRGLDWLAARPETAGRRVALVGVSKGAEAGLLIASRDARVCAIVAAVPSSVAWTGINPGNYMSGKGSWSEGGKLVAFAPYGYPNVTGGIRGFYEAGLATAPAASVIPVEKIGGPVLLISGRDDKLWPSTPMAEAIITRLDRAKFRYPHTHLAYDGAGHAAFGRPFGPSPVNPSMLAQLGGTDEGTRAARADNWPKALAFLGENLKGRGCAPL